MFVFTPLSAQAASLSLGSDDIAGLRAAVGTANAAADADTILLTPGMTYALLPGAASEDGNASGDIDVTGPLVVDGRGAILDAASVDRFFDVLAGGSLTLTNVTVTRGVAPSTENGGAVRVAAGGALTLTGTTISTSTALNPATPAATAGSGGAIATAGALTVSGSTFTGNTATRAGGAIEVLAGGQATVTGSTFTGNNGGAAPGNGGGLHITGAASATVTGSTLTGNTAAEGGALWNSATGTLSVAGTTMRQNTANGALADQGGGAVFTEGGPVTIAGSTIDDNDATGAAGSGGGILSVTGKVTVTNTAVTRNTAVRAGGGIEAGPLLPAGTVAGRTDATVTALTGVDLSDNVVTGPPGNGGGLHLTGAGTVTVDASTVRRNSGVEGGGLWLSAAGQLTVTKTEITDNTATGALADQGGGAIFTEGGAVGVTGSQIRGNRATGAAGSGGGILNVTGQVIVSSSTIAGNTAVRAGGGVEAGPLLAAGATPGRADATSTVLTGVALTGNVVTGPPGNGGGLHLTGAGKVLVQDSTVGDNKAVEGGGLWNSATGSMAVLNSTLSGNSASGTTPPVGGGALYNDGGGLVAINVTISGNTAASQGGAVYSVAGTVDLLYATITGNSSGITGAASIANSVLTGNAGPDVTGPVVSYGGNVLKAALAFGPGRVASQVDVTGVTDPRLGGLAANGGPTATRLPAKGSPAIDAGVQISAAMDRAIEGVNLMDDQRGVLRPLDGDGDGSARVDSGAVEAPAIRATTGPNSPRATPVRVQPDYTG